MAYTIWFTGLPYSGKTTLANELVKELKLREIPFVMLDDKKMKKILSSDLEGSKYGYYRHVVRLANVSYLITSHDVFTIVCTVAPKKILRSYAKSLIKNFVEVYVSCPLEICEQRANQKFSNFSAFYEESERGHLKLDTHGNTLEENVKKLMEYLDKKVFGGEE